MARRIVWTHDLQSGVPAIVTEMYLPQPHARRSRFIRALEGSLDKATVKEHFEKCPTAAIKRCLPEKLQKPAKYIALKDRVLSRSRTFGGFSVYDVLGAFVGNDGVVYDSSSCVRLIDPIAVPQANDLPGTAWSRLSRIERHALFQATVRTMCGLRQHHDTWPNLNSLLHPRLATRSRATRSANLVGLPRQTVQNIQAIAENPAVQEIVAFSNDWVDEGSFLLYGFLGYHLQKAGSKEKQIWLTSHFAVLNVYKRKYQRKR